MEGQRRPPTVRPQAAGPPAMACRRSVPGRLCKPSRCGAGRPPSRPSGLDYLPRSRVPVHGLPRMTELRGRSATKIIQMTRARASLSFVILTVR
jgi:hypothetical protein